MNLKECFFIFFYEVYYLGSLYELLIWCEYFGFGCKLFECDCVKGIDLMLNLDVGGINWIDLSDVFNVWIK